MSHRSTNYSARVSADPLYNWRGAGLNYFAYNYYLRRRFGERIQKVSVDGGFTCPNVDGTVAVGGCTFCDNRSFSPSRRRPRMPIVAQIDEGISRIKRRYKVDRFLAYFQPATNTYAPVARLRRLYEEALSHPQVVGLAIGTRPDCLPPDVLALLAELSGRTYLSLEVGVQTMHDASLEWMNRGHNHAASVAAVERSRNLGFELCAHVMLGLPGESREDMLATAREIARLGFAAVKIHNLYAVLRTPLGDDVLSGQTQLLTMAQYVEIAVSFMELLPPGCLIERVSGEAPPEYLVAPQWCLDKPAIRAALATEFERRQTYQGRLYEPASA